MDLALLDAALRGDLASFIRKTFQTLIRARYIAPIGTYERLLGAWSKSGRENSDVLSLRCRRGVSNRFRRRSPSPPSLAGLHHQDRWMDQAQAVASGETIAVAAERCADRSHDSLSVASASPLSFGSQSRQTRIAIGDRRGRRDIDSEILQGQWILASSHGFQFLFWRLI